MVIDNGLGPNKRLKSLSCFPLIINTSVPSSDQSFCFLWSGFSREREILSSCWRTNPTFKKEKRETQTLYTERKRRYIDSIHTHHQHMEIYRERCLSLSSLYFTILSLSPPRSSNLPSYLVFFFYDFQFSKTKLFPRAPLVFYFPTSWQWIFVVFSKILIRTMLERANLRFVSIWISSKILFFLLPLAPIALSNPRGLWFCVPIGF